MGWQSQLVRRCQACSSLPRLAVFAPSNPSRPLPTGSKASLNVLAKQCSWPMTFCRSSVSSMPKRPREEARLRLAPASMQPMQTAPELRGTIPLPKQWFPARGSDASAPRQRKNDGTRPDPGSRPCTTDRLPLHLAGLRPCRSWDTTVVARGRREVRRTSLCTGFRRRERSRKT
jgi:hypothetical protein